MSALTLARTGTQPLFRGFDPKKKRLCRTSQACFSPFMFFRSPVRHSKCLCGRGRGEVSKANPKVDWMWHCWNSTTRNARNPFVYYILLKGASQPEQGMPIKSVFAVESALHARARSDKTSRVGISDGTASRSADSSHSTLLWKRLSRSRNGLRTDVRRRPRLPQTPRSLLRVKVKLTGSR